MHPTATATCHVAVPADVSDSSTGITAMRRIHPALAALLVASSFIPFSGAQEPIRFGAHPGHLT